MLYINVKPLCCTPETNNIVCQLYFKKIVNFPTVLCCNLPFRTVSDMAIHTCALKYGHKIVKTASFW